MSNDGAAEGHSFADHIGQLVTAKYQALFGTTTYSKRRVMSGIVMTRRSCPPNGEEGEEGEGEESSESEVVCVSSGTKCINGEQVRMGFYFLKPKFLNWLWGKQGPEFDRISGFEYTVTLGAVTVKLTVNFG